jgi:predicted HTH transcriptional regulator
MQIVEHINQNGKITIGDISKMFEITRQAALKEVSKLVKKNSPILPSER